MKVGDLVKFAKEHWDRPGFDYTRDWIGLVVVRHPDNIAAIHWTLPSGNTIFSDWHRGDGALEVISECW